MLTNQDNYRLLIELEDWSNKKVYAEYSSFRLEPESEFYRLRLGTYQGNAGDSMIWHNGKQFTTLDRDRDVYSGEESGTAARGASRAFRRLRRLGKYGLVRKKRTQILVKLPCWKRFQIGDGKTHAGRAPFEPLHLSEIQSLLPSLTTQCSNFLFSPSLARDSAVQVLSEQGCCHTITRN